jgi:hypothetical protein
MSASDRESTARGVGGGGGGAVSPQPTEQVKSPVHRITVAFHFLSLEDSDLLETVETHSWMWHGRQSAWRLEAKYATEQVNLIRLSPALWDIYCKEYCNRTNKTGCLAGGVQTDVQGARYFEVGKETRFVSRIEMLIYSHQQFIFCTQLRIDTWNNELETVFD